MFNKRIQFDIIQNLGGQQCTEGFAGPLIRTHFRVWSDKPPALWGVCVGRGGTSEPEACRLQILVPRAAAALGEVM